MPVAPKPVLIISEKRHLRWAAAVRKSSSSTTTWPNEKLLTCAVTLLAPNAALATFSHWFCAFVLNSAGVVPAGTAAGSNGIVIVAGTANVVPCGVNANICPIGVRPGGSGGALSAVWSTAICVTTASAPWEFRPSSRSARAPCRPRRRCPKVQVAWAASRPRRSGPRLHPRHRTRPGRMRTQSQCSSE